MDNTRKVNRIRPTEPVKIKTFAPTGQRYPAYMDDGQAMTFILPFAEQFCVGRGLDIGAGACPFPGSMPVDRKSGGDAMRPPIGPWDYVFSSHCLEHLENYVAALGVWVGVLRPGGNLFLYLPSPTVHMWWPEHNRAHRHVLDPERIAYCVEQLGFEDVLQTGVDLYGAFCVVGAGKK